MRIGLRTGLLLLVIVMLATMVSAQAKRPTRPAKVTKEPAVAATPPAPTPASVPEKTAVKSNERPAAETGSGVKRNIRDAAGVKVNAANDPVYFYEFTRPGFSYSRIVIEHDEAGKGKISFSKDGSEEMITDPVNMSAATIAKIDENLSGLSFLESTENYQYSRDYSHMGNTQITVKKNGRERTVKYNWTDNKNAKFLMDEYRRIANEYTWRFEISVARENQQLQTPAIMDALDSYLRRNEISDPVHMLPFLTGLTTDERLPLIARNHAVKIVKQIEKTRR